MNSKKFIILILLGVFFSLLPFAYINYNVDPYSIIRKNEIFYKKYDQEKSRYYNPGLIQNYSIDNALITTSLLQNVTLNKYQNIFKIDNFIKLSIPGGSSYEFDKTISYLIEEHPKIENIYIELNSFVMLPGPKKRLRCGSRCFPEYLYKNSAINLSYLINYQNLVQSLKIKKLTKKIGIKNNEKFFNEMYFVNFMSTDELKKNSYTKYLKKNVFQILDTLENPNSKNMMRNFNESILEHVKKNPKIKFHFIFMPKSIYYYKLLEHNDYLNMYFELKNLIFKDALDHNNLRLHDLENNFDYVYSIKKFKDLMHLKDENINQLMYEILNNSYTSTKENYQNNHSKQLKKIKNFIIR